jgi:GNAT superfamily N-acetyltransferase
MNESTAVTDQAATTGGDGERRERRVVLGPADDSRVEAIASLWATGWADGHRGRVPPELAASRTPAEFRRRAAERVAATTVAVDPATDELLGFVVVADDEVEQLYVAAPARGSGVADDLFARAEAAIAAAHHPVAWLAVVAGNERARSFYHRSGWRDAGEFTYRASVDGGWVDVPALRYEKVLTTVGPDAP